MIDPAIEALLDGMRAAGFGIPQPMEPKAMRAALDQVIPAPEVPVAERRDLTISTPDGNLPARFYRATVEGVLPLVVFFHGGGWVHGTLETHDRLAAAIAERAQCAVLSVDYRLAPEHPFPTAFDDAVATVRWARDHAKDLGIDPARYAVAGDSAGGNLSAAVAVALAGSDEAPVHQVLFYPVLDGRCDAPSYKTEHPGFLSIPQMLWYWDQYAPGAERRDPRASPSLAPVTAALAPATIVAAGNDPLHDEAVAYAKALKDAGVATSLRDVDGGVHGFVSLIGIVPLADETLDWAMAELRAALSTEGANAAA